MRRRTILGVIALVVLALLLWPRRGAQRGEGSTASAAPAAASPAEAARRASPPPRPELPFATAARSRPARAAALVALSGRVFDVTTRQGVAGAEVLARGELGEASATTGPDGAFAIAVPAGSYRLAVRGDRVMSLGIDDRERLAAAPAIDAVALGLESLMPRVVAARDVAGIELPVRAAARISVTVTDPAGRPVAHAVVRALGNVWRPIMGSDVAESDDQGHLELVVPAGAYQLDATHPRFAGPVRPVQVTATAGAPAHAVVELAAGCEIRGRVVRADGSPASAGAIERRVGPGADDFEPAGEIARDGTFRWTGVTTSDITLRAWPWGAAPSDPHTFACADGARFGGVELRLPDDAPVADGTVVDASGAPVPLAYIDIRALDPGAPSQQERADATGHWQLHAAPPGRYVVTSSAPGLGFAATTITVPQAGVTLALAGTGRITGTVTDLEGTSFVAAFESCIVDGVRVDLDHEPRIVQVTGGHFTIDGAPACDLVITARAHLGAFARVTVPAGGTGHLDLGFAPRTKLPFKL